MTQDVKPATWLARLWAGLRKWWTTPVKTNRGGVTLAAFVIFWGFTASFWMLYVTNSNARERDIYRVDSAQYAIDKANFDRCLATIPRADALRAQFAVDAIHYDELAALVPDQPTKNLLSKWADDIRNGAYLALGPLTIDDCVDPGAPPEPPG